jgi:flagellar hook assembly protein FlgD
VAIGFTLGRSAPVTARVYNRAGRLVREVVSGEKMGPGSALLRWDGRDHTGITVADGLYLVTVEAMGHTQRKTIAVVK